MSDVETISFSEYRASLVEQGYEPTYNDIDRSVSESEPCAECGGQTKYEGWKLPKHVSYLAFSVCQSCGHWFDF